MEDLLNLSSKVTVPRMLERDMFQKRLKEGKTIYMHEFLYPLMQGYDSVVMNVDVEVCGTDQIFNALTGRDLLQKIKNKDKFVVAVTLMENPKTGELMSKSKGIGVFLDVNSGEMFAQIMAQPDEMIEILFVNNTYLPIEEIKKIMGGNPRDAKARLAKEIVKLYHGEKSAESAEKEFNQVFKEGQLPTEVPEVRIKEEEMLLPKLIHLSGLAESVNEAKRLILDKAVEIDGETQTEWKTMVKTKDGMIIRVGKRRNVRIKH